MTQQEYEKLNQECWEKFQSVDNPRAQRQWFNYAFDRAYALGKQEKDANTVIQGWVGRDMNGSLYVYCHEPERNLMKCLWEGEIMSISVSDDMFPDLTWESDPIEVELIIKRKKK